jgi:hypothetical protein
MSYRYFNEKGECCLPSATEIAEMKAQSLNPTIFIDSCVCLHISKLVDHKRNAKNIDREYLLKLNEYITKTGIKLSPFFALIELSTNTGEFSVEKYKDLMERVDFFNQIPPKHLKKFNYNFNTDYFIINDVEITKPTVPYLGLDLFYLNTYCCLLKIRGLALRGLNKTVAEKNINDFFTWMRDDLDLILGLEYKLALNIFGGHTEFRKMIWLEGKHKLVKQKLKGTSWDITHARLCMNNFKLNKILKDNIVAYFLTSDTNLIELVKSFSLTGIIDCEKIGSTSVINTSFAYPHFTEEFIDKNNLLMINTLGDRFNKEYKYNIERTKKIISQLEIENSIA